MARSSKPEQTKPAQLTIEQMRRGIPKLKKRLDELYAFDPTTMRDSSDTRPDALQQKIDATLVELLGPDTIDYDRFYVSTLNQAPIMWGGTPLNLIHKGFAEGKQDAISKLETLIQLFEERIGEDPESPAERAKRGLEGLQLHPEILRAVEQLFKNGHYSNAIEDACKVLDLLVKMRSGKLDISGTDLMNTVFSPKSPILKFSELQTESEKSEQQGMMHLFAGAMLAFRNPRAHGLVNDSPEQALEIISFISFLASSLDKAKR